MDDRLKEILDALPERTSRSRLEPFRELVQELRRRRRTYREIAQVLVEECKCRVSISTLHDFVRLQRRGRGTSAQPRTLKKAENAGPDLVKRNERKAGAEMGKSGKMEVDAVHQRIAALKRRPPSAEAHPVRFDFDPSEPLRLPKETEKNRDKE